MIFKAKFRSWLFIGLAGVVCTSCDEEFFTKTIDVESDWQGPEAVVQARLNTADDTLSLLLHYSKPVFDVARDGIHHIPDAEVHLEGSDGSRYQFYFDTTLSVSANYFALADSPLMAGVTYELIIDHPDLELIRSRQTMPQPLVRKGHQWTRNYRRDWSDTTDYTLLELYYEGTDQELFSSHIIQISGKLNGELIHIPADFASTRFEFGSFDFQEELFDHLSVSNRSRPTAIYEINTEFIDFANELNDPVLKIYASSITKDDFLFHETVSAHSVTANIPFVEAVIVYGNVENALGVFSLTNTEEYSIPLPN